MKMEGKNNQNHHAEAISEQKGGEFMGSHELGLSLLNLALLTPKQKTKTVFWSHQGHFLLVTTPLEAESISVVFRFSSGSPIRSFSVQVRLLPLFLH